MPLDSLDATAAAFIGGGAAVIAFLGLITVGVGYVRTIGAELRPNDGTSLRDVLDAHLVDSAEAIRSSEARDTAIAAKLDQHTKASDDAHATIHDRIDHAFAELGRR